MCHLGTVGASLSLYKESEHNSSVCWPGWKKSELNKSRGLTSGEEQWSGNHWLVRKCSLFMGVTLTGGIPSAAQKPHSYCQNRLAVAGPIHTIPHSVRKTSIGDTGFPTMLIGDYPTFWEFSTDFVMVMNRSGNIMQKYV